jgi:DNA-binding Lrp family transcriptional regulator
MKYIPLFGEDAKHRNYIGKHWNRKYIRAIQSILNVTKGIVASGRDFFYKAFGRDEAEFEEILYMPETYIVYRKVFEEAQLTNRWRDEFNKVRGSEDWQIAQSIIHENAFKSINMESVPERLRPLLTHYIITRDDLESQDQELDMLKKEYSRLIKKDKFIDLTLTYDFE